MLKNSSDSYGCIAIGIHWLMALALFFMFGLGLYMVELTYYDAWYKGSLDLHKSLGMLLVFIFLFRLFWSWSNTRPTPLAGPKLEQKAAHWMHNALYVVILVLMLSGYLISTADGRAIELFGLIDINALPWAIDNQEDIAGEIHNILSWLLISLVTVHALAALKHQFINGDSAMRRMLIANKNS